jgi:hypothetical protein
MPLKFILDFVVIVDFDLGDEPIQSQADSGVGDVVGGGQVLERSRKKDEPLDESEVFVLEEIDPALGVGLGVVHGFVEVNMEIILNIINVYFNFIDKLGDNLYLQHGNGRSFARRAEEGLKR